jgi:thiamine-phosphate pyrophosphorylase
MKRMFTAAAERALQAAAAWSSDSSADELDAPQLLLGLLEQAECRAAQWLTGAKIDVSAVRQQWPQLQPCQRPGRTRTVLSPSLEHSLRVAEELLDDFPQPLTWATEHLLLSLVAGDNLAAPWLRARGLQVERLLDEMRRIYDVSTDATPLELQWDELLPAGAGSQRGVAPRHQERAAGPLYEGASTAEPPGEPASPPRSHLATSGAAESEAVAMYRILDAAANRAGEGLRAVEDYLRFVLDDPHLTAACKHLRHELHDALARIPAAARLAARETQADVGTRITTPQEATRRTLHDVAMANLRRVQEALRSLEEYSKLLRGDGAHTLPATFENLRYRCYTLQRLVGINQSSRARLAAARLYVLIDGCESPQSFERLARALIDAGVHVLQLRDKRLTDRQLRQRAEALRLWTRDRATLLIVNDRPDIAALVGADGVHVGQEELRVKDARRILGTRPLVGVSTHNIQQAGAAVADGADYLGAGPVFASTTKSFDALAGLDYLRAVAREITLPVFAIGGITLENVGQVLETGIRRVAVSAAVCQAPDPAAAARAFLDKLADTGSA